MKQKSRVNRSSGSPASPRSGLISPVAAVILCLLKLSPYSKLLFTHPSRPVGKASIASPNKLCRYSPKLLLASCSIFCGSGSKTFCCSLALLASSSSYPFSFTIPVFLFTGRQPLMIISKILPLKSHRHSSLPRTEYPLPPLSPGCELPL